jgi:hypothetical protein
MIQFTTTIKQFAKQGEKTGWTYIAIPAKAAQELKPGNKKTFRVKGRLDNYAIEAIALLPMGEGDFIMALNVAMRKGIKKTKGAKLLVQLEVDKNTPKLPAEFIECLADESKALAFFKSLSKSHQNYFGNWIKTAKTETTQAKRIAQAINALEKGFDFGQMMRALKASRE